MARMEYCFDHGKRSLHQGSCPADCLVSPLLPGGKRMISSGSVRGLIHRCLRPHAEISLVSVDRFPLFREVDPAVVEGGGRRCDPPDELMILVLENMEFVPKIRFRPFLCPGAIMASPRFRLIPPRGICTRMTGISGDETCVLNHTLSNRQSFLVDLTLRLLPDGDIFSRCNEAFAEEPDGGMIRDGRWIIEKVAEGKAIIRFTFELRIRKPIPLLKDEEFDS